MSRYRVTTTRTEVHIVDAHSEAEASATAITLSEARARPAYALGSTAEAEFYADVQIEAPKRRAAPVRKSKADREFVKAFTPNKYGEYA